MWIKECALAFIGLVSGIVTAAGIFSFITMVGVLTRLATRTGTANRITLYEDCVTLGAAIGNFLYFKPVELIFGRTILVCYGLFGGIFVGCLAIALAEVLNVIPTLSRRMRLKHGLAAIVCSMGLAKAVGTLYQLVWMGNR